MLEDTLLLAFFALVAGSALLLVAGTRRWPGFPSRLGLAALLIVGLWTLGEGLRLAAMAGALVAGAIGFVTLATPRRWFAAGSLFYAALLVTAALYVVYLARATVVTSADLLSATLGVTLLLLEVGAIGLILASAFEMVDAVCSTPPEAPVCVAPERWPVVCLQVPTYNEPPDLVIETLRSLAALDYPALRVQVIDNNTTDDGLWRPVEAECERLRAEGRRVDFVHLPTWPGYKAGALNWGLAHLAHDVEIVGVVDADYIVERGWLRETVPHFTDPSVAFVQTPQDYRAWEESGFYRACYAGFAYFFKVGMVSRARRNAIIFAGTMGLLRRSVLDGIGGWDERIITEDAEASLRILARGHRSVYVPRAYGRGIMPLTYEGLRKQRFRWAFGGIQILRQHWRALLPWSRRSGLTFGQRYDHLVGGLWWFNDALTLAFTVFVVAAALGAIAGRPFVIQRLSGIGVVLPIAFIALNLIRYLWGLRTTTGASVAVAFAGLRVNLSLSWVIALACARGLVQERGVFLRTPKFRDSATARELRLVWVETAIAVAALALLAFVVGGAGFGLAGLSLALLLGWSVLVYGSATAFALGDPTRSPLGEALRQKARLELAPRVGRALTGRPAKAGALGAAAAIAILLVGVMVESGRPPVSELPFQDALEGPLRAAPVARAPAPTDTPASQTPSPSQTPGSDGDPSEPSPAAIGPAPTPVAGDGATPAPAPTVAPAPTPRPSPPVPVPTPQPTPVAPEHTPPVPVPTPQPTPESPGQTPPVPLPSSSRRP